VSFYRGFVPERDQLRWDYLDVSADPHAWECAELREGLQHDLVMGGFKPLGCVCAVLRWNGTQLIDQVWVGDGGRVMVTARDGAELATLFEDGSVVKTAMRMPMRATLANAVPKYHRDARHEHELVSGTIEIVLARHRERVAPFEKESPVVLVTSMREYFAARLRAAELRDWRMRPQFVIALWIALACSWAGVVGVFVSMIAKRHHHASVLPVALTAFLAGVIAYLPGHLLANLWLAPLIMRFRRGPAPRPAAELLEMADLVEKGRLPPST
jgi:hypothetical protein